MNNNKPINNTKVKKKPNNKILINLYIYMCVSRTEWERVV